VKVLVVGASGILGRALVPQLLDAGHRVRAVSRHPLPGRVGLEALEGDLLSSDLRSLVDGCEAVVHAATAIPRDPRAPGAWDLNTRLRTLGTRRLVEAARAGGVRRYVQQSIIMAYADGGDRWLDETAPFDTSPARAGLVDPVREMESTVRASAGLEWCILRGGQFAGPGTAQDALRQTIAAGSLVVPCAGAYYLSPVHPADMAAAIAASVDRAPVRSIFNIVGEPIRYLDYVNRLADDMGVPHPPLATAERPCPASHRCSAAAARGHLGWSPTRSIWPVPR
jgi:nucleoside-diphosphate-sugar epimerase